MADDPNRLSKLWQELKRRKVVKVIILYSTTAFIIIQLANVLESSLNLPLWFDTMVTILLIIGFPIAVIFSWIFDVTPEGIQVTVASHKNESDPSSGQKKSQKILTNTIIGVLLVIVAILVYPLIFNGKSKSNIHSELERSIAVLPFENESNDSTNVYIINGMMESILNNLSKIKDIRVISRKSVEKFRNSDILLSELAKELNVNYIVEGSGQRYGDQLFLTVHLHEGLKDNQLWSEQYQREVKDIINLQIEVSKTITNEIQAVITPEEEVRINKAPTENPDAYDFYLKGNELVSKGDEKNLEEAKLWFEKAIKEDNEFALAYAELSILLSNLRRYGNSLPLDKISKYADLALFYDPQSHLSLLAKAVYFQQIREFDLAIIYLQRAIEYNSNSSQVYSTLSSVYGRGNASNPGLLLEYAIKALYLNQHEEDSIAISRYYNRAAYGLRTTGFYNEAIKHLDQSILYHPKNWRLYSNRVEAVIERDGDYKTAVKVLLDLKEKFNLDGFFDMSIAKNYFKSGDLKMAHSYYENAFSLIRMLELELYPLSNVSKQTGRMAYICKKLGHTDQYEEYLKAYLSTDTASMNIYVRTVYNIRLNCLLDKPEEAIQKLKQLSKQEYQFRENIRNIEDEPLFDIIRKHPGFDSIISEMNAKFWEDHERINANLTKKGLLPLKM